MSAARCAALTGFIALLLTGCAGKSEMPISAGTGGSPTLPDPQHPTIPTVKVAPAVGWHDGETPTPAASFAVGLFAHDLDHPALAVSVAER